MKSEEIEILKPYRNVARRFWQIVAEFGIEDNEEYEQVLGTEYHHFCKHQDEEKLRQNLSEAKSII